MPRFLSKWSGDGEASFVAPGEDYVTSCERYAAAGVDVERAMLALNGISISLQCWQGDDVRGFENRGAGLGGGLAVIGAYRGRARTPDELREDLDVAHSLIPGSLRINLHASYAETGGVNVDRDALEPAHFSRWMDWAAERELGLDFNPTFFSHPRAEDGWTLAHPSPAVRAFWIEHGRRCREIGAAMGQRLGSSTMVNVWIPDGSKEVPADRLAPRVRLAESLDAIFSQPMPAAWMVDAVEPKLFGLGSEGYVVGSHDFYVGYAIKRARHLCLDLGHYHPTEDVADKLSALLPVLPGLLIHASRGVRWDSDHVPVLDDALRSIAAEAVRLGALSKVRFALDYFDASINRVAAWVIGARNLQKALLIALLEPPSIREAEAAGDLTARLAMREDARSLPWGAVWNEFCARDKVPSDGQWLDVVRGHERDRQSPRTE
jgi:L-rhamnose isomerase